MRIVAFLFCLFLSLSTLAQQHQGSQVQVHYTDNYVPPTKAQLEASRKEIQDAINETEQQLEEIKKNKNATMSQLRALQYKLAQRQTLIANINDEIGGIDKSIVVSSKEILTLKQKLEILKIRYAQSIRYAYETRSSYDMLAFLFSSSDFNDAVRRMKYLKKFREFRKQQVDQIRNTQEQITHKIGDLNKEKEEKDDLLSKQKNQTTALQGDVKETADVIQGLKGKEKELQRQAENNRKIANRINEAINKIIIRQMEEAAKKAQTEAAATAAKAATVAKTTTPVKTAVTPPANPVTTNTGTAPPPKPRTPKAEAPPLALTPTDMALANSFEGNKGKLPWPVAQGSITDHFGVHPDPLHPHVQLDNSGIDIRTTPNAPVRAVFEGTVSSVIVVEGSKIVVIEHGNYFTVYNNLSSVSVSKGQHISTGLTIGTVAMNDEDEPTLKFQVWKSVGKSPQRLNPEQWLPRLH